MDSSHVLKGKRAPMIKPTGCRSIPSLSECQPLLVASVGPPLTNYRLNLQAACQHYSISSSNESTPIPTPSGNNISFDIPSSCHKVAGSMPRVQKESFRWLLPRAPQHRLVYKNGDCNISRVNINKRGQRYLADIFTTLVDIKWRWNLLIFALAFTLSWLIFGLIWWLICFSHGDMSHVGDAEWKSCVEKVHDFQTALLFSIETQQTIGYGYRCMNPHCPHAIIMLMLQSIFGIIIQALMTGLIFAKLSRPKKRAQTLLFSKTAVVCERDSELCLLFRVGDMRRSHIVDAQIRAIFINKRITKEGEMLPHCQRDLSLGDDTGDGRLFLFWPSIVEHRINISSPLWEISGTNLQRRNFEIVVILEGIVESTGMTTQARTSYLPSEILWGHRFERLIRYERDNGHYLVDYSKFNSVTKVQMSTCSAKERSLGENTQQHTDDTDEDEEAPVAIQYRRSSAHHRCSVPQTNVEAVNQCHRNPSISITPPPRVNGMTSMLALAAFDLPQELPSTSDADQHSGLQNLIGGTGQLQAHEI